MAKGKVPIELPKDTVIEVVTVSKGFPPLKRKMTIREADMLPKQKGWSHLRYQVGFSSY